jgi:hypothetical protein
MTHGPLSWRELVERDKQKSEDARGQIKRAAMQPTPRPQEAVMQSELKPCPFCSEQCATLAINQGDKWAHYEPSCLEVRTGYDLSDDAAWRAEAIAAWNTRASDAEITRLTEALRAAEEREKALREALDCLPKHLTRTRGAKPC